MNRDDTTALALLALGLGAIGVAGMLTDWAWDVQSESSADSEHCLNLAKTQAAEGKAAEIRLDRQRITREGGVLEIHRPLGSEGGPVAGDPGR
jgi:hypothetical protein